MDGHTETDALLFMAEREEPLVFSSAVDRPATQPSVDPEAEWDQRILAGLKRMDTDPAFRAEVRRRTH